MFDSIGPQGAPKAAREFWVERQEAPFMYEGHYYTAERIRSLLVAFVETGNSIYWCRVPPPLPKQAYEKAPRLVDHPGRSRFARIVGGVMRACRRKSSKALAQNTGFLGGGYHGGRG